MIVVTGPGRSGTSILAALYQRLGYDPGGTWNESVNAGLEQPDIVRLNKAIAIDLRLTMMMKPKKRFRLEDYVGKDRAEQIKRRLGPKHTVGVNRRIHALPWNKVRQIRLLEWDRLSTTVTDHRAAMIELSERFEVVKDPQFTWTLPAWLESGAAISSVVLATRNLESTIASRTHRQMSSIVSYGNAKNASAYALGLAMTACWDREIDLVVMRYPDFLTDLKMLHGSLPLLRDLPYATFETEAKQVIDVKMVHH